MKQNGTKNMILIHLEDLKAKIVQKSINTIKLPFEGPFKDKYAGRSPERILCLYSVRLVSQRQLPLMVENKIRNKSEGVYTDIRFVMAICPRTCL